MVDAITGGIIVFV